MRTSRCATVVRAGACMTLVVVVLIAAADAASAHPLGLPAFARITTDGATSVTVAWTAAPDDVAALARSLGVDVAEGAVLSREQDAELSASPALREALLDRVVVVQDGADCTGEVEVSSLVERGATVRFTCPRPVDEVAVGITLLTNLDARYRTLAVAATDAGAKRLMYSSTAQEHVVRLSAATTEEVDAGTEVAAGDGASAAPESFGGTLPFESQFVALIDGSPGAAGVLLALLVAFGVGAAHGLAPGHGKAIAAAYLVGERGRRRDAVLLGVAVALMHTWSVLALGFALYSATRRPATAQLSRWLQAVSGVVVAVLGGWLVLRRLRERRAVSTAHSHDGGHTHTHVPPTAHPLSWPGLVALGAAGGLLPSPSALLVLFTALAVGRLGYGLTLIGVFSLGLATTVTVIGLLVLRGRDVLRARAAGNGRVAQALSVAPLAGAVAVTVLGAVVAGSAIAALLRAG